MASALRTWLLITSIVVALAAVWLAVCAPRSLAHLPAHERIAKHAVMVVFSYLIRLIEILCDNFGLNYFSITRSMFNALLPLEKIDPRVKIENRDFDGVRVRIYFPNNRQTHSPAMLFIHGGGWIYFNTEHFDGPCQWFALELQAVVVSVEYHHLPEHRYPATLDDCFRALQFLMRHASNFDIDPTRVAIAGDSAGGHLTAALVMRWRREVIEAQRASNTSKDVAMPPIRMQVLIYPGLQMINSTTVSLVTFSDPLHGRRAFCKAWTWLAFPDNVNDRAVVRALCANNQTTRAARERLAKYFYFGPSDGSEDEVDVLVTAKDRAITARVRAEEEHPDGDPAFEAANLARMLDPEVSPLFVDSFEDLPSTYVVTCGFDPIRDDGLLYVRRLRQSGTVKVAHKHYPLHMHGFMNLIPNELQHDLATFLADNPNFF